MKQVKHNWEYLEWVDALAKHPSWCNEEDVLEWAEYESFTVSGFYIILDETDFELTVAQTVTIDDDEPMYNSIYKIPKGWIKKRKTIKV